MKRKLLCAAIVGILLCSMVSAKSDKKSKRKAKKEAKQAAEAAVKEEAEEKVQEPERSLKRKVAIYRFSNESKYAKGAFYDSAKDPVSKQAVDSLSAKLAQTGKFIILERLDIKSLDKEVNNFYDAEEKDTVDRLSSDYIIIGSVTSYGRQGNRAIPRLYKQLHQQTED